MQICDSMICWNTFYGQCFDLSMWCINNRKNQSGIFFPYGKCGKHLYLIRQRLLPQNYLVHTENESVRASQIATQAIHPVLPTSRDRFYTEWPVWSQISSNFLTRCFTTSAKKNKKNTPLSGDLPPPSSQQPPWELFLNESQTASQLGYHADPSCQQLL